jgi:ABC-2 type transport system permease protein
VALGRAHAGVLMFWKVVRVEWRNLLAERAAWWLLGLLAILVTYAAVGGASSVRAWRAANEAAVSAEEATLENLRAQLAATEAGGPPAPHARDPADPAVVGRGLAARAVTLPATPLAPVAAGQRDVHAGTLRITTQSRLTAPSGGATAMSGPTRQMTGAFDLAFVFVFLLPLLIIALTYDLLAGERERGTLALVLSQPVSLATFVLGKTFQRALVVVGITVALAVLALLASAEGLTTGEGLVRGALYLAALVAYAAFWFAAAVAVNSRGRTSAGNALALVGLWLALVVAVPGLVRVVVETIYPPPSRVELVNLAREAASEIEEELTALEGQHGAPAAGGARLLEVQAELDRRVQPVVEGFRRQLAAQQSLVNRLRFLSPAILLNEALVDVAGTGAQRQQRFEAQVDAFHARWRAFFTERARDGRRLTSADYAALPAFAYEEEPLGALSARVGAGVAGLFVPALLLLVFAATGLRRAGRLA